MQNTFKFWLPPIAAALLVGYVVVTWGLRLAVGGAPQETPTPVSGSAADVFPGVSVIRDAKTAQITPAVTSAQIALVGIVLPKSAREMPRAVLNVGGKPVLAVKGEKLADGSVVEAIESRRIWLSRDGSSVLLELDRSVRNAPPSSAPTVATSGKSPQLAVAQGCGASVEQRRTGIVFNTEILVGALQNPSALENMVIPGNAGLIVKNSAGIGGLIGLRDADVIRAVGGSRVNSAKELATAALLPLTKAQVVSLEIERAGNVQVLSFLPPGCRT